MPTNLVNGITLVAPNGSYGTGWVPEVKRVATADATTTVLWASPVVAEGKAIMVQGKLLGRKSDATAVTSAIFDGSARRQASGNLTVSASATVTIKESNASTNVTFAANTSNQTFDLSVVGIAAENWIWEVQLEYTIL